MARRRSRDGDLSLRRILTGLSSGRPRPFRDEHGMDFDVGDRVGLLSRGPSIILGNEGNAVWLETDA